MRHDFQNARIALGFSVSAVKSEILRTSGIVVAETEGSHIRIVAEVDRRFSLVREVKAQVDINLQRSEWLRQSTLARAFHREIGNACV